MKTEKPLVYRPQDARKAVGASHSTFYSWQDKLSPYYDQTFPAPIVLGGPKARARGYIVSEIEAWLGSRPRARQVAEAFEEDCHE